VIPPGSTSSRVDRIRVLERRVAEAADDLPSLLRLAIERRRRGDLPGAYDAILGARALAPRDQGVRRELESFPAWPSFRGGAGRTGSSATRGLRRAPRIRWVRPLEGSVHISTPTAVAVSCDRVFVTVSSDVYARGEDGLEPARPRGRIYALDAHDGRELWSQPVRGLPSAPTHASETDLVIVVVWRGSDEPGEAPRGASLLALDAETGSPRFRVDLPALAQTRPLALVPPPLALGSRAIVATTPLLAENGRARIACVDLGRGELVWQVERVRLEGDMAALPNMVYVRSEGPGRGLELEGISVRNGVRRFGAPVASGGPLVAAAGRVLAIAEYPSDQIACLDGVSGQICWKQTVLGLDDETPHRRPGLWRQAVATGGRFYAPVVVENEVLLPAERACGRAFFHRLDLATGKKLGPSLPAPLSSRGGISVADGVIVGSGGAVGLASDALERVLWRDTQIRDDQNAGEDLAVAHGRIFGVARSGVAFCFDERLPAA
jgi:outer membrane protein assembly factor BamB